MKDKPFKKAAFWLVKSTDGHGERFDWIAGQNRETIESYFTNPHIRTELVRFSNIRLKEIQESEFSGNYVNFLFQHDEEMHPFSVEPGNFGYDFLSKYYEDYINEFFAQQRSYWDQ